MLNPLLRPDQMEREFFDLGQQLGLHVADTDAFCASFLRRRDIREVMVLLNISVDFAQWLEIVARLKDVIRAGGNTITSSAPMAPATCSRCVGLVVPMPTLPPVCTVRYVLRPPVPGTSLTVTLYNLPRIESNRSFHTSPMASTNIR